MKSIWLTRPRDDSESLAAKLPYPAIIAPVMRITPLPITNFDEKPQGIILTSRHALHASIPSDWRDVTVYCVGDATAAAARRSGFTSIVEGGGDALLLAARIADIVKPDTNLLYLRGEETRVDLPVLLAAHQIPVRSLVVYEALAETSLPHTLIDALKSGAIGSVVFYSPRSALLTAELLAKAELASSATHINAFCVSMAVAAAAGQLPWQSLKVATNPSTAAMVELIETSAI